MINSHVHIFNIKCAPNNFYGAPIARMFSLAPTMARGVSFFLDKINPLSKEDKLSRLAAMVDVGIERNQKEIFQKLLNQYQKFEDSKIVALTLDMDFMGAGKPIDDYISQVKAVADIKIEYPNTLIPFFCVDPRRPNVLSLLKKYVSDFGFTGIKLYPALGFYPFDPRLYGIYEYAIEQNLPIISHCDIGGIFYRGPLSSEHLLPKSLNPSVSPRDYTSHFKLKKEVFKNFFTNPSNFEDVLEMPEFKNLKICMAHFGGGEMIENENYPNVTGINWYRKIKEMIRKYPNVYTDISYTLYHSNKGIVEQIQNDLNDPQTGSRILFGTDYYMTVRVKKEEQLIDDFIKNYKLSEDQFYTISETNNRSFLATNFFNP